MKRRIVLNLIFAVVLFSNTSCNKWLTLQPQDGTTIQEYWQTKEQIQAAVVGCYSSLLADPANSDKKLSEYLFMWGELRADMLAPGPGISNDETDVMDVNTLPTNTIVKWNAVYRTINYCNTVIDHAPAVLALDNTLTKTQLNAYLSEAHALRALMYFYLVRSFRDVPLKLKSTSTDDDLLLLPKTSSDTVLTQIIKDLNFADSNAVTTYGNTIYNKGRITTYTVKAIKADVYLWMDNYTECVKACDYIINSGQFGLIAGNNGWFNTLYYNGNSNESIFEFQYDAQALNSFYNMFIISPRRYYAAGTVMEDMYTLDPNNSDNYDIRGLWSAVRASDNTVWKYLGVDGGSTSRALSASYAHWFVYRYADILMMKAEALNQIGGRGLEALALVYKVRYRANALAATDLNPDPSDQSGITDFILAERAREFAFEGKRWYDVLRNAKRNKYARLDILTGMVAQAVPATLQQTAIGKYKDSNSHYFPIYTYELQNDPYLIQNPYYK
jgi:hypothetical protein